jgi:hypothetical protein
MEKVKKGYPVTQSFISGERLCVFLCRNVHIRYLFSNSSAACHLQDSPHPQEICCTPQWLKWTGNNIRTPRQGYGRLSSPALCPGGTTWSCLHISIWRQSWECMALNFLSPLCLRGGVLIEYKKTSPVRLSLSVRSFAKVTYLHGVLRVVLMVYVITLCQLYKLSK